MHMENKKENIEVIIENSDENLEISPVYEHLNVARPKPKENKEEIIIPEIDDKKDED